jgi:hypothetical protein
MDFDSTDHREVVFVGTDLEGNEVRYTVPVSDNFIELIEQALREASEDKASSGLMGVACVEAA